MANGPVVNQGKTAFVEEFLASNRGANLEELKEAWTTAGNEGTVSESLITKIRARLGLTGKKAGAEAPASTATKAKRTAKARKPAKPVEQAAAADDGPPAPSSAGATSGHDDDEILDELEEAIDELIQKIREHGGKPDVVKALKRARRLLVQGHGG